MKSRRVAITGLGMVSPLGLNVRESWNNLIAGKSSIIDCQTYKEKLNLDIPNCYISPIPSEFDYDKWKIHHVDNRSNSFGYAAATEALKDSGIDVLLGKSIQNERVGISAGVLSSNIDYLTQSILRVCGNGFNHIQRLTMLHVLNNMIASTISIALNLKGPISSQSTSCCTGASNIIDAYNFIKNDDADIMFAGGAEEVQNPTIFHACLKMQAMLTRKFPTPDQSSRPFDKKRSGFVLGEGAGMLVLEEMDHALQRGANIYGELVGYAVTSDANHLVKPAEDGEGAYRAMSLLLKKCKVDITEIDLVNCHATSTPVGDIAEGMALLKLFGKNRNVLEKVSITANKGAIGHTFGAAGAIESIFTILALKEKICPGILNLNNPADELLDLNFIRNDFQKGEYKNAIKNSLGFGGINVSLLFQDLQQNENQRNVSKC